MSLDLTDYVSIGSGNGFVPSGSIEQAITWANIDLTLCRHMVSQGHNDEAMAIVIFKLWQLEPLGYKNQMLVIIIPPAQRSCWRYTGFTPSVCPSVRPSRMPCPLCIIYSYGWILFILGTNDHYHERVCRAPWPLTLTYIFKVIWPWLRKSCPLCSVYSSGWILPIFGTNDHYH